MLVKVVESFWQAKSESNLPELEKTIVFWKMRHIPVMVLGPSHEVVQPLPKLLISQYLGHENTRAATPGTAALNSTMQRLVHEKSISCISLYQSLCPTNKCLFETPSGVPVFFGTNRLGRNMHNSGTGRTAVSGGRKVNQP